MVTLYSLYVVLLFVTAIIGIALAAYAWQHRRTPGVKAFAGVMLGMALSSFSLAMLALTNFPDAADFWGRRVRFIANTMIPGLLLIFAIQYTGRGKWLNWPRLALLFTIPLISLGLTWSGEAHYLFLHFSTAKAGPFTFLGKTTTTGPWNVVHLAYIYLAVFLSFALLLLQVFRTKFPYRGQAILLFVGGLFPLLANVPDSFMAAGPRPSFTPFGIAALGLIYAWALFRYRLFELVPVARDLVVESMADAVLVLDEQHRLVDVNLAAQALIGQKDSELIGRPIADVLPACSDLGEHQDHVMRAEIVMGTGGAERHIALREQPILKKGGHLAGCLIVLRDITHQKLIEKELRESEEKYRDLVERISDVIYTIDTTGELTYVSPAIEGLLGYRPSELIGQPFSKFVTPEDLEKMRDNFQQLSTGIGPGPNVYRLLTKTGEVRWIRTSSHSIADGEQISGVRGMLTDITDLVRAEAQREQAAADTERERLARDLHDAVTQTLYSIALTAEALPRVWEKHPDQAQEALSNLHRLARGALGEIRTLLFELRPAMLLERDLAELLRQLAHATMGRTQTTVEVSVQGERALPDEVRVALYRIAQEALNNATKHAEASQVIVELDLEPEQAVLDIKDDGRGFDPEAVPQVGFGVGNMADRAKEIGAAFSLQSNPGQGTQIQVMWPEQPSEHPGSV